MHNKPKLVLDTNIWLDLVVFEDLRAVGLRQALASKSLSCYWTPPMRAELAEVISRPIFKLLPTEQANFLALADAMATTHPESPPNSTLRCKDPDDQMFLDLAITLPANYLLSKDKALLRLASRAKRQFDLEISACLETIPNNHLTQSAS